MKEIIPVDSVDITVEVPGSKSLTQRALIAAAEDLVERLKVEEQEVEELAEAWRIPP